jgi:hypothetical protein
VALTTGGAETLGAVIGEAAAPGARVSARAADGAAARMQEIVARTAAMHPCVRPLMGRV